MSLYIRDLIIQPRLKAQFLSTTFSAIAYGIVVVLAGGCFHLLLKKWDIYPNRKQIILPIYVIVMLLCSTWRLIGSIYQLMSVLTSKPINHYIFDSCGVPITLIVWGADGFMVSILITYQEQR